MTEPIPEKAFYRPDELARMIAVSTRTVRRWMRMGLIRHVRVGKVARIPRAELERVMSGGVALCVSRTAGR